MIKMIFSDMDGTLLDEQGQLPDGFDSVIRCLRERGVMFAPCSGRQYFSLLDTFWDYREEFLFLAENGTMVRYRDKELFSSPMDHGMGMQVICAVVDVPHVYTAYCGKKHAYVLESQYDAVFAAEMRRYYTHCTVVRDFEGIDDEMIKASFWDSTGQADCRIYDPLCRFQGPLQVALSSDSWVDVMNADINKGVAVRHVQRSLGVRPEECAAFGDYLNDAELMEAVGYSFAMANAHPAIKQLARYETESNAEHGVLRGIRRLIDAGLCDP